ncbi:uncharacterized protein [Littorina saxatilis]|uniref:Uncharacterized protein n=1 Tax=Littorina saxatilis TaxID=31220 RepID=A0AAN9B299_9CAEN
MAVPFVFTHRHLGYQIGCGVLLLATVLGIFGVVSPGWYSVEQTTGKQYYSHLWIVCSHGLRGCRVLTSAETKGFEKAAQAFAVLGILCLVAACLLATFINFLRESKGHNRWLEIAVLVSGGVMFLAALTFVAGNPDYIDTAWNKFHSKVSNGYGLALTFVAALLTLTSGGLLWVFNRPLEVPSDQRSLSVLSRNDPVARIHRETQQGEDDDDGGFRNAGMDVTDLSAPPKDSRNFGRARTRNGVAANPRTEGRAPGPKDRRGMRKANGLKSSEAAQVEEGVIRGVNGVSSTHPSAMPAAARQNVTDRPRLLPPPPDSITGESQFDLGGRVDVDLNQRGRDLDGRPRAGGQERSRNPRGSQPGGSRETSFLPQPPFRSQGEGHTPQDLHVSQSFGQEDNYYQDISGGDLGDPTPSYFTGLNRGKSGSGFELAKSDNDHVYSELRHENPSPSEYSSLHQRSEEPGYKQRGDVGRRENAYGSRQNASEPGNTRPENAYGMRENSREPDTSRSKEDYSSRDQTRSSGLGKTTQNDGSQKQGGVYDNTNKARQKTFKGQGSELRHEGAGYGGPYSNEHSRHPDYVNNQVHAHSNGSHLQARKERSQASSHSDEHLRHQNDPRRRHSYDVIGDSDSDSLSKDQRQYSKDNEFQNDSQAKKTAPYSNRNDRPLSREVPRNVDGDRMPRHTSASRTLRHSRDIPVDLPSGLPTPMCTEI